MKTIRFSPALLVLGMIVLLQIAAAAATVVFHTDFDSGVPPEFSGAGVLTPAPEGFAPFGITGNLFRNATASPQVLSLTGLPAHQYLHLDFLLAIIDSWDGSTALGGVVGPDIFRVTVDGQTVFERTFDNFRLEDQTAPPNPLSFGTDLGFLGWVDWGGLGNDCGLVIYSMPFLYPDSVYDLGQTDVGLKNIPHTASTATLRFESSLQGGGGENDETYALDNLRISVSDELLTVPPEPPALVPPPCEAGDFNGDGCVDRGDLDLLLAAVRAHVTDLRYDLNADGQVSIADARKLVLLFSNPGGLPCSP